MVFLLTSFCFSRVDRLDNFERSNMTALFYGPSGSFLLPDCVAFIAIGLGHVMTRKSIFLPTKTQYVHQAEIRAVDGGMFSLSLPPWLSFY